VVVEVVVVVAAMGAETEVVGDGVGLSIRFRGVELPDETTGGFDCSGIG